MKLNTTLPSLLLLLICICTLRTNTIFGQQFPPMSCMHHEANSAPREHGLDIEKVSLEVQFDCPAGKVMGTVTHQYKVLLQRVDSIFFDGPGIQIQSATLNGLPLKFVANDKGITVYPAQPLKWDEKGTITFQYTATPRKGVYFIGWNDPQNISRKQIWTQGQGIDHRHWIPCYDDANDKVISEVKVTFDAAYRVLSNGNLINVASNGNQTKTWHYSMTKPHSLYLLMLAIGQYNDKTLTTKAGVPVHLWYYPEDEAKFPYTYKYSTECIDFVAEHTQIPYPWQSYSQVPVQDFIYGAMENTTATIFGDFFCVDARDFLDGNYIGVNVHELTHQWFGDYITHRSPNHIWLHESFATWYPKLFNRRYVGEDAYQWQRRGEQNNALEASKKDILPVLSQAGGTARVYSKGSAVLDMFNYTFGEDQFRRVLYHYLKNHPYQNVETNDLYQSFQDTLGLSPDWFFEQWIYRGGEPEYQVSYQEVNVNAKKQTIVKVSQIHPTNDLVRLFKMPIVLEVHYTDRTKSSIRAMIDQQHQSISIENPGQKQISFVLFDPGSYILKKVQFNKSFEELAAQAQYAEQMIDRYDACVALKAFSTTAKRDLFLKLFRNEKNANVRAEILQQLLDAPSSNKEELYKSAAQDKQIEVRKALINHSNPISEQLRAFVEPMLSDSSYNIVVTALEKLCIAFPQHAPRYLQSTKGLTGMGNRVQIKWLEMDALLSNSASRDRLVSLSSNSYEFRTRQNAMNALLRLNHFSETLLDHLLEALFNPNTRLSGVAATTLKSFAAQHSYRRMIQQRKEQNNYQTWQLDLLNGCLK
jgi:aminopeptidase N